MIRNGLYTKINGIDVAVSEYYGHGLDPDIEINHRLLSCENLSNSLEGFTFNVKDNRYHKDCRILDLNNAFMVHTKALHNNVVFDVASELKEKFLFHLTNREPLTSDFDFFVLKDGYGKDYNIVEVTIDVIEKIWEERGPSEYNIPMPEGLERIKVIYPV